MPSRSNSQIRLRRLLQLVEVLQSGRTLNTAQLAEILCVSRRTVFRDLGLLQEAGVPVMYDVARQTYTVPHRTFLPPTDLTLEEALALLTLCHELANGPEGIPFQYAARTAALKLAGVLPQRIRAELSDLTNHLSIRIDPRNQLEGTRPAYETLLDCISARRCLRMTYGSLTPREEICTRLSPYRLMFSRRSWYVIGRSSFHRAVRTFNLGRIRKIEPLTDKYQIPARFSIETYLGNAWHLIRGKERHAIHVRFQNLVAENVAEVNWHKTQRVERRPDGTLDFYCDVDGINEIAWWILGYGDQAEVIAPPELRRLVAERVGNLHAVYSATPPP